MSKKSCALCGIPLGMFESRSLTCCGEDQALCMCCFDEMSPMSHIQRTHILLDEGRAPTNVDSMQKTLARLEAEEEMKRKAKTTDLKCLRCGAPMKKIGRKKFQMGTENFFIDTHVFEGSMELDVLRCSNCRKVEFFTPEEVVQDG